MPEPPNDYWTPLPPIGSGFHHRTRHSEDAIKRGSDSLLEAKLKEHVTKPRSLTNRAQSLDLTYSLSRLAEPASRLPPPDSPTNSTGDTGANSSPTSMTAPSFPSVYDRPLSSRASVISGPSSSMGGSSRGLDPDALEEVTRVISNLGL